MPEIVDPDFEIELETITAMKSGSGPAGGGELLPGAAVQFVPHAGAVLGSFSKPLKAAGASPPLNVFSFAHWAPQKVTWVPTAEFPSPITKLPPTDVPKIRTTQEVVAVEPPSSTIETVMVKNPVEAYV